MPTNVHLTWVTIGGVEAKMESGHTFSAFKKQSFPLKVDQSRVKKSHICKRLNLSTNVEPIYFNKISLFFLFNIFFSGGDFRVSELPSFQVFELSRFQISKFPCEREGGRGTDERPDNWSCDLRAHETWKALKISRIRETLNISTDANSSTYTIFFYFILAVPNFFVLF